MAYVRAIPERGAELVRKADLGSIAAAVVHQHQERWDGSGYPRRLKGKEIHHFARLCAVCDVFDSLTSDRPHRPAQTHGEALAHLQVNAGRLFDPQMVKGFSKVVAPFPVATYVRLSTGEIGVVVGIHYEALERPVVKVVRNSEGERYARGEQIEIDLATRPDLTVERAVAWHELLGVEGRGQEPTAEVAGHPATSD